MQRELFRHRVPLRLELSPSLPMVLADRVQLKQVIINLVMNGIEDLRARSTFQIGDSGHAYEQATNNERNSGQAEKQ